jgi:DNA-binding beta-propeller fold protein YncE
MVLIAAAVARCEEKPEVVIEGLDNPSGVAVQPGTGQVFVSDSAAGRVVRVVNGEAEDVITGFPQDVYGKGPMYDIGPLGLAFLDQQTLIVSGGDKPDGEEVIRVFKIPNAGEAAINIDKADHTLGPLPPIDDIVGEGNFYALAVNDGAVFATSNGDDTKGWIVKADRTADGFGELQRFIATKEAVEVDAPVGATINDKGHLVIGQMGEITIPHDSLLSFYDPKSGELLLNLETGLYDIAALAYSPKGHLYALDFAWMATGEGGLFRLDADRENGQQTVKAVKIAALDKPTAMAFGEDGALYVTVFDTAQAGEKPGKLLKFAPGL